MSRDYNYKQEESQDFDAVSIYDYIPGVPLELPEQDLVRLSRGIEISEFVKKGIYGPIECHIVDALYKYYLMNRHTLSRYIDVTSERENAAALVRNILDKMKEDGILYTIRYGTLVLYSLTDSVREEWSQKKSFVSKRVPSFDTPYQVLEYASLAQFSVSVMEGEQVHCNHFHQVRSIAKVRMHIPSYVEMTKAQYRYRIFAYPFPKDPGVNITDFLEEINRAWGQMAKNRRKGLISLTVIVVPSVAQMEALDSVFRHYTPAAGHRVYYCTDSDTAVNRGLQTLYWYEPDAWEGTEYQLKTIELV